MSHSLPLSQIEDVKEFRTVDVLNIIQDVHLYFEELNSVSMMAHYLGHYGQYEIKGLVSISDYPKRYRNHEPLKTIKWWNLSIEANVSGFGIQRTLITNGAYALP